MGRIIPKKKEEKSFSSFLNKIKQKGLNRGCLFEG